MSSGLARSWRGRGGARRSVQAPVVVAVSSSRRKALRCKARAEAEEQEGNEGPASAFQRAMKVAMSRGEANNRNGSVGTGRSSEASSSASRRRQAPSLPKAMGGGGHERKRSSAKMALSRLRSEGGGLSLFQARKKSAKVKFQVQYRTEMGQTVRVVGSSPELGAWDVAKAPQLKWQSSDGLWACDVSLPCGQIYEYKYVVCNGDGVALQWQQGNNALLAVGIRDALAIASSGGEVSLEVLDRWSGPEGSTVLIKKGDQVVKETTREHRLTSWIRDVEDQLEQGSVQVKELQLELASAKQELMQTRQEVVQAKEESQKLKEIALQSNEKYLVALKEKEKALRQKELVLRQLQLDRFDDDES
ncbi:starch-binding protein [Chloropicon primus]|uniref:Starch-binding protein n=1 Tax=Chloropicon primus TaxID=1764295 RepID=A0A5B8MLV3_9CHLO|nr:starch-binding protein [Chloropicon primus]UPQ99489.1 starch-binding protein [Chloropicon primus]|mmetsp:Transcript_8729/g.24914  ORF Transcript_8729/g.24914 Transcript_8729/m.24914 type:complete len:361 (+) Transcript_8729:170-1252(+)|eukprot:QDZ20280.1 starch-binding protein [Chloropicon primus]